MLSLSSFEIVFIEGLGVVLRVQGSLAKCMRDTLVGSALENLQMRLLLSLTGSLWVDAGDGLVVSLCVECGRKMTRSSHTNHTFTHRESFIL